MKNSNQAASKKKMIITLSVIFIIAIAAIIIIPKIQGNRYYSQAQEADLLGQSENAMQLYEKAIQKGNMDGAFRLGELLVSVSKYKDAAKYWGIASEEKDARAYLPFAKMLLDPITEITDTARALTLLANDMGEDNGEGKNLLAGILLDKHSQHFDSISGISALTLADESGNSDASLQLGRYYLSGKFVNKDAIKSISYFERALTLNNFEAARILAAIYDSGEDPVKPDREKSLHYYILAGENGDDWACAQVADKYRNGDGTAVDYDKSAYWAEKSYNMNGNSLGAALLGLAYYNGQGKPQDVDRGRRLIQESALAENPTGANLFQQILENERQMAIQREANSWIVCPRCNGKGYVYTTSEGFDTNGHWGSRSGYSFCISCGGSGRVKRGGAGERIARFLNERY